MALSARASLQRRAVYAAAGLVFAFLILPLAVILPVSFTSSDYLGFPPPGFSLRWYRAFFDDPVWIIDPGGSFQDILPPGRHLEDGKP